MHSMDSPKCKTLCLWTFWSWRLRLTARWNGDFRTEVHTRQKRSKSKSPRAKPRHAEHPTSSGLRTSAPPACRKCGRVGAGDGVRFHPRRIKFVTKSIAGSEGGRQKTMLPQVRGPLIRKMQHSDGMHRRNASAYRRRALSRMLRRRRCRSQNRRRTTEPTCSKNGSSNEPRSGMIPRRRATDPSTGCSWTIRPCYNNAGWLPGRTAYSDYNRQYSAANPFHFSCKSPFVRRVKPRQAR
jgi:hypothetical protein